MALSLPIPAVSNRVALVEDHPRLAMLVERGLGAAGIAVDTFATLEAAWHGLLRLPYALAIVDRGLPDGDGLTLIKRLRAADNQLPCLMLTAKDALHDRVAGLDAGADDYLPKPFAIEELTARVRALMRRPVEYRAPQLAYHGLQVLPELGCMRHQVEHVSLAPAELQLIILLVRSAGQIVRRSALEAAAWGVSEAVTPNALDVALHRLRKKLGAIDAPLTILNVRSLGFSLLRSDAG